MYICSQLLSSLLTPSTADRNQKMIMYGLPFVFVFFVINFPAGLIVYWITTNLWTVGQGYVLRKRHGSDQRAEGRRRRVAGHPGHEPSAVGSRRRVHGAPGGDHAARRQRDGADEQARGAAAESSSKPAEAKAKPRTPAPAAAGRGRPRSPAGRTARTAKASGARGAGGEARAQRPAATAAAQEEEAFGEAALMADDDELDPAEAVEGCSRRSCGRWASMRRSR